MNRISNRPKRQDVLEFLAHAVGYGNLGLFIGAGFSKAVLSDGEEEEAALSWAQLLEKAAKRLQVKYADIPTAGLSYPAVASAICAMRSAQTGDNFAKSLRELKNEVARLTGWYPSSEQRNKYSKHLEVFNPAWIITTNYDLVIEALLTGKSVPLGPNDPLLAPKGFVPVYHLHGVRTQPQEMIISQEDYISLFRPTEYRQIKLALTVKESATLFLGYGLGDVNVLTALDWSKNVFKSKRGDYPNDMVQVLRKDKPRKEPYRDENRIVILETADLLPFFEEFGSVRTTRKEMEDEKRDALRKLADKLSLANAKTVSHFIDSEEYRAKVLERVSEDASYLITEFISFFNACIEETWERARPKGAFEAYNQNLNMVLDTLTAFDFSCFPPALFQTAAESLERVASYVGNVPGQSYAASSTWQNRKGELSRKTVAELALIAQQYGYSQLRALLKSMSK